MGRKNKGKKPTIVNQPKKVSTTINRSSLSDNVKSGLSTGVGFALGNAAINTAMNAIGDKETNSEPKENICDLLTKNYIECLNKSNNCEQVFDLLKFNKCIT